MTLHLNNINNNLPSFKDLLKIEIRGASIYTLATFLSQFGSFLIVPLFWQKLSVSDYGIIAIIDLIGSFLGMFLGLQLDFSITRFYYEWSSQERKHRLGTLWMINWLSTILIGIVSIYLLSLVNNKFFEDVPFFPLIFLGLIYNVIGKLSVVPYATIRIINLPILYAFYSLISFIVQMLLNIYFVIFLDQKLYGLFISNIISSIICVLIGLAIMLRFAIPCIRLDKLKEPLKFSIHQIPASAISSITNLLDRFLLLKFASLEALGIYTISLKFTGLILQLHNALKMSFVPYMVKILTHDQEWGIKMLTKMRLFYILPLLIFSLAISIYIKDFVYWINKPEYFPVVKWVPWLIGPTLISTFNIYFAPGLFLSKRSDLTWIPSILQMLMVIFCGLLLIPPFKMVGLVISRYASALSLFLVSFILSEKYYPINVKWSKLSLMLSLLILIIIISNLFVFHLVESILLNTTLLIVFSFICIVIIIGKPGVYSSISVLLKNKSLIFNKHKID